MYTKIILTISVLTLLTISLKAQNKELVLPAPTHEKPVSIGAVLLDGDIEGEKIIQIKTRIKEGYHIYAYVPAGEAYIKTEQGIELPEGTKLIGDWEKTVPSPYPGNAKLLIYKGENSFQHKVSVANDVSEEAIIKCWLYYQCCNADLCLPPAKKEFELIVKN